MVHAAEFALLKMCLVWQCVCAENQPLSTQQNPNGKTQTQTTNTSGSCCSYSNIGEVEVSVLVIVLVLLFLILLHICLSLSLVEKLWLTLSDLHAEYLKDKLRFVFILSGWLGPKHQLSVYTSVVWEINCRHGLNFLPRDFPNLCWVLLRCCLTACTHNHRYFEPSQPQRITSGLKQTSIHLLFTHLLFTQVIKPQIP